MIKPYTTNTKEYTEYLKPQKIRKLSWTDEEIELLIDKASEYGNNWHIVHKKFFQHRTLGSIQSKYYGLKKLQLLKVIQQTKNEKILPDNIEFSKSELNLLKDLKSKNLSIYEVYMRYFSYRNPELVFKQFKKLNYSVPLIQGTWSNAEVDKLFEGLKKFGRNWKLIANYLGTRNQIQCMMYWDYHMNRLKSNRWTLEDDNNLLKLVEEFGRNWVKIGKKFRPNKAGKHCKMRHMQLTKINEELDDKSERFNDNIKEELTDNEVKTSVVRNQS